MIARRFLLATVAALALVPLAEAAQDKVEIVEPWARASLSGRNSAAYMTIHNHGTEKDELIAASSPVARVVELHTHIMDGGVMRMRPVNAIEVNVGEPAVLRPGGLHVMLIDLTRDLKAGEKIPLTLRFRNAGERTIEVPVLAPGATGHGHGHGHGHRH
ncbi:copper chaperone PCu(A)C [Elioraea thermophila]|uniref:copper chaperone PCu(A)C n=1 Tax=Elioraea thermophila TaxID=2185104 RepID=UPI000DF2E48B|nr:copper chaperone PCu(A)C [Elioraea thermophila]